MFIKPVTYHDPFSGNEVTDSFYFNITQAEILDIEAHFGGAIVPSIQNIIDSRDPEAIIEMFKYIIGKAYGERPVNTNKFIKSKEITDSFIASEAYSELLFDLLENKDSATEFFKNVFPDMSKLKDRYNRLISSQDASSNSDVVVE